MTRHSKSRCPAFVKYGFESSPRYSYLSACSVECRGPRSILALLVRGNKSEGRSILRRSLISVPPGKSDINLRLRSCAIACSTRPVHSREISPPPSHSMLLISASPLRPVSYRFDPICPTIVALSHPDPILTNRGRDGNVTGDVNRHGDEANRDSRGGNSARNAGFSSFNGNEI